MSPATPFHANRAFRHFNETHSARIERKRNVNECAHGSPERTCSASGRQNCVPTNLTTHQAWVSLGLGDMALSFPSTDDNHFSPFNPGSNYREYKPLRTLSTLGFYTGLVEPHKHGFLHRSVRRRVLVSYGQRPPRNRRSSISRKMIRAAKFVVFSRDICT